MIVFSGQNMTAQNLNAALDHSRERILQSKVWEQEAEIARLRRDDLGKEILRVHELSKRNAEIERLRAALRRIEGINDNPAVYSQEIEDVIRKIFPIDFPKQPTV